MSSMPIRLLLVDDHPMVLQGIRAWLEKHAHISIAGEARGGKEAVEKARELQPDVVVMDISMPDLNGIEASRQLRKAAPGAQILALSMHENPEYIREVVRAGARGYLLKDASPAELIQAVEHVHRGESYFSPTVSQMLLTDYFDAARNREEHGAELTAREREVLARIGDGLSNKEIAARLGVSTRTIESHRERIMRKLNIHSVVGLIKYALARGLTQ